jgi:DNA-binding ferritin-like protein (Dps family)
MMQKIRECSEAYEGSEYEQRVRDNPQYYMEIQRRISDYQFEKSNAADDQ